MKFPRHIPQWVRDEYPTLEANSRIPLDNINKIIQSDNPDIKSFWSKLEKSEVIIECISKYKPPPLKLLRLTEALNLGLSGLKGSDVIMPGIKKKLAKSINKDIDSLIAKFNELKAIEHNGTKFPDYIYWGVGSEVNDLISNFVSSNSSEFNESTHAQIHQACHFWLSNPQIFLNILIKQTNKWADLTPAIKRPNHINANRHHFFVILTNHFSRNYGELFRRQTLAIGEQFFDCSDITEDSLSELAPDPLKERKKFEKHTSVKIQKIKN